MNPNLIELDAQIHHNISCAKPKKGFQTEFKTNIIFVRYCLLKIHIDSNTGMDIVNVITKC